MKGKDIKMENTINLFDLFITIIIDKIILLQDQSEIKTSIDK